MPVKRAGFVMPPQGPEERLGACRQTMPSTPLYSRGQPVGWREIASVKVGARGTIGTKGTIAPQEAPNVPIVPNVPALVDPRVALADWHRALDCLHPCEPPAWAERLWWLNWYDRSAWFFNAYGRQAAREGWTMGPLFGVVPGYDGKGGLLDRLGECRGLELRGLVARWRSFGVDNLIHRDALPSSLVPWWEAGSADQGLAE